MEAASIAMTMTTTANAREIPSALKDDDDGNQKSQTTHQHHPSHKQTHLYVPLIRCKSHAKHNARKRTNRTAIGMHHLSQLPHAIKQSTAYHVRLELIHFNGLH
jgi:hypothetical protein